MVDSEEETTSEEDETCKMGGTKNSEDAEHK